MSVAMMEFAPNCTWEISPGVTEVRPGKVLTPKIAETTLATIANRKPSMRYATNRAAVPENTRPGATSCWPKAVCCGWVHPVDGAGDAEMSGPLAGGGGGGGGLPHAPGGGPA